MDKIILSDQSHRKSLTDGDPTFQIYFVKKMSQPQEDCRSNFALTLNLKELVKEPKLLL